jgi:hypothetical protein
MVDEQWKHRVDDDMKACNEQRIRLEEHDKTQQKEIDESKSLISDLYDYKNDIYKKITESKGDSVTQKDHNALAKCVTQLKTERKFLPYVIMIVSLIGTIVSCVYMANRLTRGDNVRESRNKVEVNERLPVLRSEMPENNK